jgi:hypothetical protein
MKFLSVRGVYDYAGPVYGSRFTPSTVLPSSSVTESAFPKWIFEAQYPAHRCRCLRFTGRLAATRAKLAVRMDSLSPFL